MTTCGHWINGDRPCVVKKPGHTRHRDAKQRERQREHDAKYHEANRERDREYNAKYYQENRERKAKFYQENREAVLEYQAKYYQENPEKARERRAKWKRENPDKVREKNARRRAQKGNVPHVDYTRNQLLELYGTNCYLCDNPLPEDWHVEHVIPLSKGGWDVPENLRPACPKCNLSKHARLPPLILVMRIWYEIGVHRAGTVCE